MTGIQSALKHDQIMDSASHDAVFIEREATQVAERAAAALKESRRQLRKNDIGTPTWTGRSGAAGAPRQFTPPPRFGQPRPSSSAPSSPQFGSGHVSGFKNGGARVSSSMLLARMRERKAMETGVSTESAPVSILDNTSREGMIVKIRDYLSQHHGRGTSQDILSNINIDIDQEQIMIFRKMLQTIAKFEKDSTTGKGEWILKQEYS